MAVKTEKVTNQLQDIGALIYKFKLYSGCYHKTPKYECISLHYEEFLFYWKIVIQLGINDVKHNGSSLASQRQILTIDVKLNSHEHVIYRQL